MQSGVIVDRTQGANTRPIWIPEPATESWFGGLREPIGPALLVNTFRCLVCGYLASFAHPRPAAKDGVPPLPAPEGS